MANKGWCLLQENAEALSKKLRTKELKYAELKKMGTDKRIETFGKFMPESDAKRVNLLFEKKMVQKDFYRGMEAWKASLTGGNTAKQKHLQKMINKRKAEQAKKIFNPKSDEEFLKELASHKVGVGIDADEARLIYTLSENVGKGAMYTDRKSIISLIKDANGDTLTKSQRETLETLLSKIETAEINNKTEKFFRSNAYRDLRKVMVDGIPDDAKAKINEKIDEIIKGRSDDSYGKSRIALEKIVGDLKLKAEKGAIDSFGTAGENLKSGEYAQVAGNVAKASGKSILNLFALMKAAKGSFDASAIGRQARGVLFSGYPKQWAKLAYNNWDIFKKSFKKDIETGKINFIFTDGEMLDVIKGQLYNRPLGKSGIFDRMKIAIGGKEEQFAKSPVSKVVGFRQSEEMFSGSLWIARADLADMFFETLKKDNPNIFKPENAELLENELLNIGTIINSITGRGTTGLGKLGEGTGVVFWSPKLIQSSIDQITGHWFGGGLIEGTSQSKRALRDFATRMITTAGLLGLAYTFLGKDKVEIDPRSSKFGTIYGIDATGGLGGYYTLLSRLKGKTKDSSTGIIKDIGFKTSSQIISDFVTGKSSPGAKLVLDYLEGYNFDGDKTKASWKDIKSDPQVAKDLLWVYSKGTFVPIPLARAIDGARKGDTYGWLSLANGADFLGFSNKNYAYSPNWNKSEAKQYKKFKEEFGSKVFREANGEFAIEYTTNLEALVKSDEFKKLADEEKIKEVEKMKRKTTNTIFEKYDFDPDE